MRSRRSCVVWAVAQLADSTTGGKYVLRSANITRAVAVESDCHPIDIGTIDGHVGWPPREERP